MILLRAPALRTFFRLCDYPGLFCCSGGQVTADDRDMYAREVETVRVPTGADRGFWMGAMPGMTCTGRGEQFEFRGVDGQQPLPEARAGEFRSARAMLGITIIFQATTVVKYREQFDDSGIRAGVHGQQEPVPAHAHPVRRAMHAALMQCKMIGQ